MLFHETVFLELLTLRQILKKIQIRQIYGYRLSLRIVAKVKLVLNWN